MISILLVPAVLCVVATLAFGQGAVQAAAGNGGADKSSAKANLGLISEIEVSDISQSFLSLPVTCVNKSAFVRMSDGEALSELVSISADGKKVIPFAVNKIIDVVNPRSQTFFVNSTGVYLLILSSIPQDHIQTLRTPDHQQSQQIAVTTKQFIARFSLDGTYLGSVPIELPFHAHQFGAFPNGDFLIAGLSREKEAKVALVKSSGQFNRFVEVSGDIHLTSANEPGNPASPGALPPMGKHFGEGFLEAAMASNIIADGSRLLLVRKVPGLPVFSVSAGGDVKTIAIETPPGFTLFDLKPGRNAWIALYTRKSDESGLAIETFALNPETGNVVRKYSYPRFPGVALGCADMDELTFLQNVNDKLKLVTLAPLSVGSD